jgi:DNA sulfur modification protein DndB
MSPLLKLPCLRGRMGDWFYYVSLMKFSEVSKRTSMVPDIHKNKELSRWIQREVSDRSQDIAEYLIDQNQRFFNAIIFGIYGGKPQWQELDIDKSFKQLSEEERDYFGKTFGILTLSGDEEIFAIDGQHRTKAIKEAIKKDKELEEEEVSVIFLAHKKTQEGEVRTRRLFSTLNRYAVPVSISEIIALDEEDNCAIITRKLIEESSIFQNKILFSKTRSLSPQNTEVFTNIVLLYDIVTILLTDRKVLNIKVSGHSLKKYTSRRDTEENINKDALGIETFLSKAFKSVPSLNVFFFVKNTVNRENEKTSLLFRPLGQMIMFSVIKVAKDQSKLSKALNYFSKDDFNLKNKIWRQVFQDPELKTLKTDKSLQKFAIQLILKHLEINFSMTKKDKVVYDNFNIDYTTI